MMSFQGAFRVVLCILPATVLAQSPLISTVKSSSLFSYETIQLTDANVASLSTDDASTFGFPVQSVGFASQCKPFPTDSSWPSDVKWKQLNSYTGGALIRTVPLAAPCYPGSSYDADKCAYITANWGNSTLHMSDPTSMMSPFWQGRTCEPPSIFPSPTGNCTLGGYPTYTINATNVAQIQLGINFARNNNIRLVVKNTGHDFSGKSGGAGALSIWTHNLKNIQFYPKYVRDGGGYTGPAFKAGSGVQAWEIFEAASKQNMVVVGGEGQTVGVMGGYIQGGGHSPLSSIYGIAADQVLSCSVVLASGQFVTASLTSNPDLFFALRGGGGSTFGVVTSVTVKTYPDFPVTATTFAFAPSDTVSLNNFWAGVRAYFNYLIPLSDAGTYSYFFGIPGPSPTFSMAPFFSPNKTVAQTRALLAPWFADLAALNITLNPEFIQYPNYLSAWNAQFPTEGVGSDNFLFGSRLFPRENWRNQTSLNATFKAWKESIDAGAFSINFNFAPRWYGPGADATAVNPAWRETVCHSMQLYFWGPNATAADILATRTLLNARQKAYRDVSPGAGSYLGESDREEPNFQQSFYGKHYARLLKIKGQVDPWDVFWAKTAVGSEGWAVRTGDVLGDENGVLCRV